MSKWKASIFDLDRTLIRSNSSFCFYFFLLKKRLVPVKTLFHAAFLFFLYQQGLSLKDLHQFVFRFILKGLSLVKIQSFVSLFVDQLLKKDLRSSVFYRFQQAKLEGQFTWLLSSSPDFLVAEIGKRLGFDRASGTEYKIDKQGRLCQILNLIDGTSKRDYALKAKLPARETVVYSDSDDDMPLFEWAGKKVAVFPNRALRNIAIQKGWEIYDDSEASTRNH